MKKSIYTVLILFIIISNYGLSQDYHFSQFDQSPTRLNPALTGKFNKYVYKSAVMYRNQWRNLSAKPFSTFNMSFEKPISKKWGVGANISNFDGAKVYNEFSLSLSGSYSITSPRSRAYILTTGLQLGFINKNINNRDLTFNNQYSNGGFDPEIASGETFLRLGKFMPDINFGVYYKYFGEGGYSSVKPYVGISVFHISSPKQEFIETIDESSKSRLARRYLVHGGVDILYTDEFNMEVKFRNQWQGRGSEYYFGSDFNYIIDEMTRTTLKALLYYRVKDAFVVGFGIQYNNMTFVTTYDITTSNLKTYNNSKGALEFGLRFAPRNMRAR